MENRPPRIARRERERKRVRKKTKKTTDKEQLASSRELRKREVAKESDEEQELATNER